MEELTSPVICAGFLLFVMMIPLTLLGAMLKKLREPVPSIEPPLETFQQFISSDEGQATEADSKSRAKAYHKTKPGEWILRLEQGTYAPWSPQRLYPDQAYALVSDESLLEPDEEAILLNTHDAQRFARLAYAQNAWFLIPDKGQRILLNGLPLREKQFGKCDSNPSEFVIAGHHLHLGQV